MSDRAWTSTGGGYRFGFNGMEKDDEVSGEGNSLDFGARVYDSRLGRWLSVDPIYNKFPYVSPYNYCENNPVKYMDIGGLFKFSEEDKNAMQSNNAQTEVYNYLMNDISSMLDNDLFQSNMLKLGHFSSLDDLKEVFSADKGPKLQFVAGLNTESEIFAQPVKGRYDIETDIININESLLLDYQNAKTTEEKEAALLSIVSTIAHETVHYGRDQAFDPDNDGLDENGWKVGGIVTYITGDEDDQYRLWEEIEAGSLFQDIVYGPFKVGYDDNNLFDAKRNLKDAKQLRTYLLTDDKRKSLIPKAPE